MWYNGRCAIRRSRTSQFRCLSVCKLSCAEKNRCTCDKSVWENLTPLEKKLSCERSEYALCTLMNKYKKKDCYNYMPPFNDGASDSEKDVKKVRKTGEPKHHIQLKENKRWRIMWTKTHVRRKVRTLADSGCSCTIFTDRNLFTDYQPYSAPITTAGGPIRSTGRGTVGKLQNCLYVPEMNMNLISTSQVTKQLKHLRFILDDGVCIIQDKTGRNADLVYKNVDDLCEVTDLKWLGISDDSEKHLANVACNNHNMKKAYIESVVHEVYIAEMTKLKREMASEDCTEEFAQALQQVYITKAEALELLHLQLGHLPYQRIERM